MKSFIVLLLVILSGCSTYHGHPAPATIVTKIHGKTLPKPSPTPKKKVITKKTTDEWVLVSETKEIVGRYYILQ